MKILLIEDNLKLSDAVKIYLTDSGFDVETAHNGVQGINKIKDNKKENINYDIVILDRMMPMKDGIEVLKEIKDISSNIGIIMLTAKDTVEDKVAGLSAGADDYMVKPFDVKELIARIHALYRRYNLKSNIINTKENNNSSFNLKNSLNLKMEDFDFDFNLNQIGYKGNIVSLTSKESGIFKILLENKMETVSKDYLFEKIWHGDIEEMGEDFNPRQIDVHVHNLRSKLSEIDFPYIIDTVRGVGYKLVF
jgi:hypothetical protein